MGSSHSSPSSRTPAPPSRSRYIAPTISPLALNPPRPARLPVELLLAIVHFVAADRVDSLAGDLARFCLVCRAFRAEAQPLLEDIFTLVLEVEPISLPSERNHTICTDGFDRPDGITCVGFSHETLAHLERLRWLDYRTPAPRVRRVVIQTVGESRTESPNLCWEDAHKFQDVMRRIQYWLHVDFHVDMRSLFRVRRSLFDWQLDGRPASLTLSDLPETVPHWSTASAEKYPHVYSITLLSRPHQGYGTNLAPFANLALLNIDYDADTHFYDTLHCLKHLERLTFTLRHNNTRRNELGTARYPRPRPLNAGKRRIRIMLRSAATLPRPAQVVLAFNLACLEPDELRRADKAFWRDVLEDMCNTGEWPRSVPKTVKEVNTWALL
ncbi:Proteophosphoglycan ppg4 [Rhodotorula toruloides ATCC 204091]|uniref:Proteophosphoglycan ppg4 n=2 Tax=Rhodotorula toruloides TaxID=5286 RepID=A0A2S9ZY07_RHOTO|nr:Proteophosphoglycan ppg4 [Rhodotorula toruloides ATCC 204091]KAK4330766.1 Proteophosphoglycan ppg4 [Rhodotorula toruloides]PRQ70611.1 Proteophosphoglycan ppg4 [Rhodotorula toruloides]